MKAIMKKCVTILGLLVIVSLASCSDGGTSSSVSANGIWGGTVTVDGDDTFPTHGLLYDGEIFLIGTPVIFTLAGNYSVRGNNIFGEITLYEVDEGHGAHSGLATGEEVVLSGTVNEQDSISVTFNTSEGNTGSMFFAFDPSYNRPSSLVFTAGMWSTLDDSLTITVEYDGSFVGQDSDGCALNGKITILDAAHNLYRVNVSISSCGDRNDSYTGFSSIISDSSTNDESMVMTIYNGKYNFLYQFKRL